MILCILFHKSIMSSKNDRLTLLCIFSFHFAHINLIFISRGCYRTFISIMTHIFMNILQWFGWSISLFRSALLDCRISSEIDKFHLFSDKLDHKPANLHARACILHIVNKWMNDFFLIKDSLSNHAFSSYSSWQVYSNVESSDTSYTFLFSKRDNSIWSST